MRIKMQDIIGARQRLINMDDSTFRAVRLLPIMELIAFAPENETPPKNEQYIPIVTVRYEQYGDMILEIPDTSDSPAVEELATAKHQVGSVLELLNQIKSDPMANRSIQVARALRCLKILNGETE
jgi:hypothetical protein